MLALAHTRTHDQCEAVACWHGSMDVHLHGFTLPTAAASARRRSSTAPRRSPSSCSYLFGCFLCYLLLYVCVMFLSGGPPAPGAAGQSPDQVWGTSAPKIPSSLSNVRVTNSMFSLIVSSDISKLTHVWWGWGHHVWPIARPHPFPTAISQTNSSQRSCGSSSWGELPLFEQVQTLKMILIESTP